MVQNELDWLPASVTSEGAECVLCLVIQNSRRAPIRTFVSYAELASEVLFEGTDAIVISDVAPLVPGHVLITSRSHVRALSALSAATLTTINDLQQQITQHLRRYSGAPVILFEHGVGAHTVTPPCGIDHAHLHALPLVTGIQERFKEDFAPTSLDGLWDLPQYVGDAEYLLLLDGGRTFVATPVEPVRQYFRRVVADITGRDFWNWNDDLLLSKADVTKRWILELHQWWMACVDDRPD